MSSDRRSADGSGSESPRREPGADDPSADATGARRARRIDLRAELDEGDPVERRGRENGRASPKGEAGSPKRPLERPRDEGSRLERPRGTTEDQGIASSAETAALRRQVEKLKGEIERLVVAPRPARTDAARAESTERTEERLREAEERAKAAENEAKGLAAKLAIAEKLRDQLSATLDTERLAHQHRIAQLEQDRAAALEKVAGRVPRTEGAKEEPAAAKAGATAPAAPLENGPGTEPSAARAPRIATAGGSRSRWSRARGTPPGARWGRAGRSSGSVRRSPSSGAPGPTARSIRRTTSSPSTRAPPPGEPGRSAP